MKVALIAPTPLMEAYCAGRQVQMFLAHQVLKDPQYARVAKELSGYKILDNSLMENGHTAMGIEDVLEAAHIINADEVVLPDVFRDGPGTLRSTLDTLMWLRKTRRDRDFTWAAVVHGQTTADWWACYQEFARQPDIGAIHIPKVMDTLWYGGRPGLVRWLEARDAVYRQKQYHLLGIWSNPLELAYYRGCDWIRSVDTALPIHAGLQGVTFSNSQGLVGEKPHRPDDYFNLRDLSKEQIEAIDENIFRLDMFAAGHVGRMRTPSIL